MTDKEKAQEAIKKGDRIVFIETLTQAAGEDTPEFLLARKGENGVFLRQSGNQYLVQPDGQNPFYANKNEFQKL